MSRRRGRRVVESSSDEYTEESEVETIEESSSSPIRRRSNRIRRMSLDDDDNNNSSNSDSEQELSNHNNTNHNNRNNHNRNHNNAQSQILYDEAKNEIECENFSSDDEDNNNSDNEEASPEITHPNFANLLPRFINTLDKKLVKLDDEIEEHTLQHLLDTATSIAEYNNTNNNYKKQTENLQNALDKLLNARKDMKIEQLMLRRISNNIREEQKLEDENGNNPIETGTWNSYLNAAREVTLENVNNNRMSDHDSDAVTKFINTEMENYRYQFKEAIQVDDIEEFDDNHNRNNDSESDNDLDIVIDRSNKNTGKVICPLTRKVFKKPFKSKICGHTFEKDAIFKYIKNKNTAREVVECPLVGCGKVLTIDGMVRDIKMEKLIKAKNKSEQNEDSDEEGMFDLTVRD
eukprot:448943_1